MTKDELEVKLKQLREEWVKFPNKRKFVEARAKFLKTGFDKFHKDNLYQDAKKIFILPEAS